ENLAREYWGSAAASIGKRINSRLPSLGLPWYEVVGVVEDVQITRLNERAPAVVYWPSYFSLPWRQDVRVAIREPVFVIRSWRAGTQALTQDARKAIASVNASLAIADILTMEQIAGRSMARTYFALVMLAIAGGLALLLGIIGTYGV